MAAFGITQANGLVMHSFAQKLKQYMRNSENPTGTNIMNRSPLNLIEERDGKLFAYEFKWNPKKKARLSKTFEKAYSEHKYQVINKENYEEFLLSR